MKIYKDDIVEVINCSKSAKEDGGIRVGHRFIATYESHDGYVFINNPNENYYRNYQSLRKGQYILYKRATKNWLKVIKDWFKKK